MVLPGVPVGRVLPAAGPGGQLDARQQDAQAQRDAHLSDGRAAAAWEPPGNLVFQKRGELLQDMRPQERDPPSPMSHSLKASSTMSPDPGLESHTRKCLFLAPTRPLIWLSAPLHSLCRRLDAGLFCGAPHAAQASGSGTHLTAGKKTAAFSRDLSQRQGAAHQSTTLETCNKHTCA